MQGDIHAYWVHCSPKFLRSKVYKVPSQMKAKPVSDNDHQEITKGEKVRMGQYTLMLTPVCPTCSHHCQTVSEPPGITQPAELIHQQRCVLQRRHRNVHSKNILKPQIVQCWNFIVDAIFKNKSYLKWSLYSLHTWLFFDNSFHKYHIRHWQSCYCEIWKRFSQ